MSTALNPRKRAVSQLEHREIDFVPYLKQPALQEPTLDGYRFPVVDGMYMPGREEKARRMMDQQQDHCMLMVWGEWSV